MRIEIVPCGRKVRLSIAPADEEEKLVAERSSVVLSLWRETGTVVRGTITHGSGTVAHFQGGETLIQMAQALRLRLEASD
jgi:hypothetical protein